MSDLKKGFDKTIDGAGNTIDIFGRDISAGWIGALSNSWVLGKDILNIVTLGNKPELGSYPLDKKTGRTMIEDGKKSTGFLGAIMRTGLNLTIPNYGMYTGAGWGLDQWGDDPNYTINQADVAGRQHDKDMNEWNWLQNTWTNTPSGQWVGPVGTAFSVLGSIPFFAIGALDGEIPYLRNYSEKLPQDQSIKP
jgi:hypothetical protein